MTASAVIKHARAQARLTQTELAKRMGTTQSVVARLESPAANPRLSTLRRAVEAAGQRLVLSARPRPASVDESMIAANLTISPGERLDRFADAYISVSRLVGRARRA